MIRVSSPGRFEKTRQFLNRLIKGDIYVNFDSYGQMGVDALAGMTPVLTGESASGWGYEVIRGAKPGIVWYNNNVISGGTPVVILLQYGHGTGTGGYVQGQDFINPAIRPIFDAIADDVWKEVKR